MLSAADLQAMYADMCQQVVSVRRYTGLGSSRTHVDYAGVGNARLYGASELVGSVKQGDQKVILCLQGLDNAFSLPLKTSDAVVVGGIERSIQSIAERKALDGTLIAYELQCRG